MISSVTLTTIVVRDFEAALYFYVNTLGLERSPNETSPAQVRGVRVSPPAGAGIVIALREDDRDVGNKHDTTRLVEDASQQAMEAPRPYRSSYRSGYRYPGRYPGSVPNWDDAVLALRTDDIFAEYRKLRERGVQFVREPDAVNREDLFFGAPEHRLIWAAFLDQDDNIIRLEQKLEKGDPGPIEPERWTEALPD